MYYNLYRFVRLGLAQHLLHQKKPPCFVGISVSPRLGISDLAFLFDLPTKFVEVISDFLFLLRNTILAQYNSEGRAEEKHESGRNGMKKWMDTWMDMTRLLRWNGWKIISGDNPWPGGYGYGCRSESGSGGNMCDTHDGKSWRRESKLDSSLINTLASNFFFIAS